MDYQNFEESTMTGNLLLHREKPLDYDQVAINHLYKNIEVDKSRSPFTVPTLT